MGPWVRQISNPIEKNKINHVKQWIRIVNVGPRKERREKRMQFCRYVDSSVWNRSQPTRAYLQPKPIEVGMTLDRHRKAAFSWWKNAWSLDNNKLIICCTRSVKFALRENQLTVRMSYIKWQIKDDERQVGNSRAWPKSRASLTKWTRYDRVHSRKSRYGQLWNIMKPPDLRSWFLSTFIFNARHKT